MFQDLVDALGGSRIAAIAVLLLLVVQICLQVYSLIDLVRRPANTVSMNKWVWALIIVAVNTIGAVVYLVAGRVQPQVVADRFESVDDAGARARHVADALYGTRERPPQ